MIEHVRRHRSALAGLILVSLAMACSSTPPVQTGTDPLVNASPGQTVPPLVEGSPGGCAPGSPILAHELGLEAEGTSSNGKPLWALFEVEDSIPPGQLVTVWWRVGGDHALRLTLVGDDDRMEQVSGARPGPLEGWERPGEPWVSEISFPQPGCWRIYIRRGGLAGDVFVQVL
jgi:hypothetical protein